MREVFCCVVSVNPRVYKIRYKLCDYKSTSYTVEVPHNEISYRCYNQRSVSLAQQGYVFRVDKYFRSNLLNIPSMSDEEKLFVTTLIQLSENPIKLQHICRQVCEDIFRHTNLPVPRILKLYRNSTKIKFATSLLRK